MKDSSRVTIKDIAREANVSVGSVYSALRNKGRINNDTKQKILDTAKKLNYLTNISASSLSKKKKIQIVAIFPSRLKEFWDQIELGMLEAEQELSDYGINLKILRTDNFFVEEQIRHLVDLKDEEIDGIAIAPAHPTYLNDFLDGFIEKNISVVTFNSDAPRSKRCLNIQNDLYRSGQLAAELIAKLIMYKGNIAVFNAYPDVQALILRNNGFKNEIETYYPDIHIGKPIIHFDNEELQYSQMKELINSNEQINSVFADNANIFGIAKAIKEAGQQRKIVVVGYDYSDRARDLLFDDIIQALICQDPHKQGFLAIKMLFKCIVAKESLPNEKNIYTSPRVIFRNSIEYLDNMQ